MIFGIVGNGFVWIRRCWPLLRLNYGMVVGQRTRCRGQHGRYCSVQQHTLLEAFQFKLAVCFSAHALHTLCWANLVSKGMTACICGEGKNSVNTKVSLQKIDVGFGSSPSSALEDSLSIWPHKADILKACRAPGLKRSSKTGRFRDRFRGERWVRVPKPDPARRWIRSAAISKYSSWKRGIGFRPMMC